jgi:outer membrane protein assembly factor BamD (BamD/ComL family)
LGQVDQDSSSNKSNSELSEDVEYSYAIVIDNSLSSYPSYDPVDGRFTNATDESKIEFIDSNDNDQKSASQSTSATDSIVNAFGESSYTTERGRVMESLDNWTRVVKRSRKGRANKN